MDVARTLEPLRGYASEPPAGLPPEILPWDHGDRWGVDGAARAALALLIAGEPPGERLFAVADYMLAFVVEGYGQRQFPDAILLNGSRGPGRAASDQIVLFAIVRNDRSTRPTRGQAPFRGSSSNQTPCVLVRTVSRTPNKK